MEQIQKFGRELAMGSHQSAWGLSKEFQDLVKTIGEAKSKAEEDRIMLAEIEVLKRKVSQPDVPKKKMKEYIVRLVYVEMLGHDAGFGYIHAVKMTHDDNLLLKRTGYLAVTLFLDEDHDLIILIVNTIQKDLKSDNHLIVCAALGAVCKLINEETIPAVLPQVVELLKHPKEVVRKKAVMALQRFYQRSPSAVSHVIPQFREVLCDKDPCVMAASLCALYEIIYADPAPYKNLTLSFVKILRQVAESRLPNVYNYHKTPAPFVQIKLLKILALLGVGDKASSEHMYTVLADVLKRADNKITIGNAILYECICTITAIYPYTPLLQTCAEITSRFLKSDVHNLKYMGIDALGRIVKIKPDFANEHQLAVIDCLEDPDDTLKRKTLDLLYKMTKPSNVEVIVERMIGYMRTVQDSHSKVEIASRIIELAERFAPTNQWFIQTMNGVFELAGDLVRPKVAHELMRLIAEGSGEDDEDADSLLRASAVASYLKLLEEPKLPSILLQVICWVLGEYGTTDGHHSASEIISHLCDAAEARSDDNVVRGYVISAITKVMAYEIGAGHRTELMPEAQALVDQLSASHSTDLQQRAYELLSVLGLTPDVVSAVLPADSSREDIQVDKSLPFLDSFVQKALEGGAKPYIPEAERSGYGHMALASSREGAEHPAERSLRFEAYETPVAPPVASSLPAILGADAPFEAGLVGGGDATGARNFVAHESEDMLWEAGKAGSSDSTKLRLDGVQKKWGRPTYTPAAVAGSSGSNEGTARAQDSGAGSSDPGMDLSTGGILLEPSNSYSSRKKQQVPEVSAEKQRLAASLFGGGSAAKLAAADPVSSAPPVRAQAGRGTKLSAALKNKQPERSAPLGAATTQAAQPDLLDLMDLGSSPAVAPPPPASDPFKELEGLLDPLPAPSARPAPAPKASTPAPLAANIFSAMDIQTLYDTGLLVHDAPAGLNSNLPEASSNSDLLSSLVKPAGDQLPASPQTKGLSPSTSLQRDAVARQAGVITSTGGANPELFKGLWE